MKNLLFLLGGCILFSCGTTNSQDKSSIQPPDFNGYWYAGEAELTSYELKQSRYGEIHEGKAVLIFVTEPFSKSKQVKLDNWRDASEDNVSVMKLNMTKKFLTGIYPYSMMMSTFTPVQANNYPHLFKLTTSSQEWCGQTFMQLNFKDGGFNAKGFSYFESEGDIEKNVDVSLTEDELWTRIRLNPNTLPTGDLTLLPSTFYIRLKHREIVPTKAKAELSSLSKSAFSENSHKKYSLEYENRSLTIYFEDKFPFVILGWEESYSGGFGSSDERLTTTAKRIQSIRTPYWNKNANSDRAMRKQLGLNVE
jgi:hypothetical protein